MSLNNLALRTKALIPLALMAFVVLAMVVFGGFKLSGVSSTAGDIIERRTQATLALSHARTELMETLYDSLGVLAFDGNRPQGKAAAAGFPQAIAEAGARLDEAAQLLPEKAADIKGIQDRFRSLAEAAHKSFDAEKSARSLLVGSDLKPEELDSIAESVMHLTAIDSEARALADDLKTFDLSLHEEDAQSAAGLRSQSRGALWALGIAGLLATALAGAASIWISSATLARPLTRLGRAMAALANGDATVSIEGQERRDEVGDMSRAVEVFKQHALDRMRLETEAATERARAESERELTAAERATAAREQTEAVRHLGGGLRSLAAGDLTAKLDDGFTAAYAELRDDFNETIDKLKASIVTVIGSSGAIDANAKEVSEAADVLSRRAEQQASSLEETSASLAQIAAAVQKSAEGTLHAREAVAAADVDAKKSADVVNQAVEAMGAIAKSSKEIGQIIGVIDEIAFQTNLLALNAGVEAARAGDAGRGFAVVASEVRALAQRSAEAAKEIKGLISDSSAQVDSGVRLVAETGGSLKRIVRQVVEINRVVADIASGSQEQATALQHISAAVEEMNRATQENAAIVEQSAAVGRSLSDESARLSELVGQFRIDRAPAEARLRAELAQAAPHVFAKPVVKPNAKPDLKPEPRRRALAAVAGGGDADWREF